MEGIQEDVQQMEEELKADIAELSASFDPAALELETETLKPTRTNVEVEEVSLLWLPYDRDDRQAW